MHTITEEKRRQRSAAHLNQFATCILCTAWSGLPDEQTFEQQVPHHMHSLLLHRDHTLAGLQLQGHRGRHGGVDVAARFAGLAGFPLEPTICPLMLFFRQACTVTLRPEVLIS